MIHEGFFLSHYRELHLYLVGTGTVGGNLLKQIMNQQEMLLKDHHLKINVIGICRSKLMLLNPEGINLANYTVKKWKSRANGLISNCSFRKCSI